MLLRLVLVFLGSVVVSAPRFVFLSHHLRLRPKSQRRHCLSVVYVIPCVQTIVPARHLCQTASSPPSLLLEVRGRYICLWKAFCTGTW
jgi:hypothetical protein